MKVEDLLAQAKHKVRVWWLCSNDDKNTRFWGRQKQAGAPTNKKHACARDAAARASGSNSAKSSSMGAPSCCITASCTSSKSRGSALSCRTSSFLQRNDAAPAYPTWDQRPGKTCILCQKRPGPKLNSRLCDLLKSLRDALSVLLWDGLSCAQQLGRLDVYAGIALAQLL